MSDPSRPPRPHVAIVGAGLAGASCAAGLMRHGWRVTVFDKARGVGGRMATRRTTVGGDVELSLDHGAPFVAPRDPRFRALWSDAVAAGDASVWRPRVFADVPGLFDGALYLPQPGMPAVARRLLDGASVLPSHAVTALQRSGDGWWVLADGKDPAGPFDEVVLAMPPRQAAALLADVHSSWAETLAAVRMEPCWTLMAATDEVDWPWDAAEPSRGPLAWVMRNDRRPGRTAPVGWATWIAHATPSWSQAHLEEDPADVAEVLRDALRSLLPPTPRGRPALRWHHLAAHRWRYAQPVAPASDGKMPAIEAAIGAVAPSLADNLVCWWDGEQALGVCGDFLGGQGCESAWRSGTALADRLVAGHRPGRATTRPRPVVMA